MVHRGRTARCAGPAPAQRRSQDPAATAGNQPRPPSTRIAIVPKGLRSFDANDSDFFLELLPGPRDKDGLPESIRFWKHRIEATDEPTFTVGVIYGPSGCGKSSLVKAGLLPRLARRIHPVYIEATPTETEARLLNGLRKKLAGPDCRPRSDANDHRASAGAGLEPDRKVLLVIDQFEQWLHAKRRKRNTELAQALRQCDGEHVQCVVMVRDDFWMAADPVHGRPARSNSSRARMPPLVDLFDLIHARKVLIAFGRAYGRLPESHGILPAIRRPFSIRPIEGLAQDGRVISIRLALFAEMVKGKPWTAGNAQGGRRHGRSRRDVPRRDLRLGPAASIASTRKRPRPCSKLSCPRAAQTSRATCGRTRNCREASGYANRPGDFDALLRILDQRASADHADRSRRDGSAEERTGLSEAVHAARQPILPTHPRLPGSLAPGVADPQAKGNPAGPGRAAAGGAVGALERQAREPPSTVGPGVGQHPDADQEARTGPSRSAR